jgi:hypothetical protein
MDEQLLQQRISVVLARSREARAQSFHLQQHAQLLREASKDLAEDLAELQRNSAALRRE